MKRKTINELKAVDIVRLLETDSTLQIEHYKQPLCNVIKPFNTLEELQAVVSQLAKQVYGIDLIVTQR